MATTTLYYGPEANIFAQDKDSTVYIWYTTVHVAMSHKI